MEHELESSSLRSTATFLTANISTLASSMTTAAPPTTHADQPLSQSRIGTLFALLQAIPNALFWIITFSTITLPTWLFTLFSTSLTVFSTSLTVTMNVTTLLLIILAVVSTVSWFVRYRFLNMYTRLPSEPQRKEPQIDLFPDVPGSGSKHGLANYLDEFFSAVKVFGYLEKPVTHELMRTMQMRKLVAGETILLEEEQGFCLVVDGLMQIFVKSQRNDSRLSTAGDVLHEDDEETGGPHGQGYQLLTEVSNGAPLSSLFSILSLFTEDVKLRYDEDEDAIDSGPPSSTIPHSRYGSGTTPVHGTMTPASPEESPMGAPGSPTPSKRHRSRGLTMRNISTDGHLAIPPLSLDADGVNNMDGAKKHTDYGRQAKRRKIESAHPDIVARATVDTTIATIPASSFRRLTRVYPRASSNIVQVILTRLQRVTLTTSHAYLGLTSEVLRTESLINRYTNYDLPGVLRGSALERLKEKFSGEKERIDVAESSKGIALHNPRLRRKRAPSGSLRKEAANHARISSTRNASEQIAVKFPEIPRMTSHDGERNGVNAGDLLTNAHQEKRGGRPNRASFSQPFQTMSGAFESPRDRFATSTSSIRGSLQEPRPDTQDEDSYYRESLAACMLKAIGLTNAKGALRKTESVEHSPKLVSYDARRQKATFTNNAFGFMDALDTEGDTESMTSAPNSAVSTPGSSSIQDELSNDVEIVFFPKGSVLVEQGERNPGLYYVIDGFLDVSVPSEENGPVQDKVSLPLVYEDMLSPRSSLFGQSERPSPFKSKSRDKTKMPRTAQHHRSLYLTKPGGLAGYLGTISSRRSFVDVTAKTDVYVGFLPRASIERIVEKYPIVLLTMAKRLTSLLPRLILHIDFALEWVQVDAGQILYRQGDDSDAIYIVLNGRLRTLRAGADGKIHQVTGEYGQGDSVGELEVLTESSRPDTLHAIRDTELAKLPKTLFNSLALGNPEITIKISKIIANRMRNLTENPMLDQASHRSAKVSQGLASSNANLRTVSILPVTAGVPVVEFGSRLLSALSQIGTPNGVTSLNHAAILNHLGRHAFSRMGKLKLSQHLADLEEKYGLVLYVADTNVNSPWTQTCISQADCILLVGLAEGSPSIGEYERFLLTNKTTSRKELVLLHAERYCPPGLTRKWLRNRMWINGSHHHIHMSFRNTAEPIHPQTRRFGSALKHRVQVLQAEIQKYTSRRVRAAPLYSADTPFKGDFHRLARRLTGKSVGLVLGGGGARGLAHIGIIRALEESGVPIDIVGGTSIGAFVGALYAWDADMVPLYGRAKKFAGRMGSMWRFALDLTYPSASYTTGHEFNRGIFKTFGTAQMEDFWLEFYCNTTNISRSRTEIHTSGYVWRYVRASMSLAGLVPPLCDDGSLLVDGGYLDNLTVAHMKSLGTDVVFAVDVGAVDDATPQAFGDSLSGFWAALNRWNPFSSFANPPTLSEIQARLAYVSSVDALERAKSSPGVRYLRPPVVDYGTLEFGKFEELVAVGHRYGKEFLEGLRRRAGKGGAGGVGGGWPGWLEESEGERKLRRTMAPRRASI